MLNRRMAMTFAALLISASLAGPVLAISFDAGIGSADEELVLMGREIPGFGGLFYDAQGVPTVYLLDPEGAGAATLKALAPEVRIRQGEYEFERLAEWRMELRPLLALPGVVFLDADEARNRVVIGVDATSPRKSRDREGLESRLAATAVPRPAVLVVAAAPFEPLAGVQSKFRPAPGGVEISFQFSGAFYGTCTLGFNAKRGNVSGFVVNSHCTRTQGELEGTRFFQNTPFAGAIGTEMVDPPYFTGPPCPSGRRCRMSDSAFVKYDNAKLGQLGKIARPTRPNDLPFSLTVNPASARFAIKSRGSSGRVGDVLHKVGKTSGWTYGTVVSTCLDGNTDGTKTVLCQTVVQADGGPGDSGSPVFYRSTGNNVRLAGILWGGADTPTGIQYIFSPIGNIERELGTLKLY
jgi:hypothetical protein